MVHVLNRVLSRVRSLLLGRPYLNVLLIAGTGIISRILGLLRDRFLAMIYGAGSVTDAYVAAFRLPDFIFNTLILGAFAAACVPLLVRVRREGLTLQSRSGEMLVVSEPEGINLFSSQILFYFSLVATVLAVMAWIFAPWFVPVITRGFSPETHVLTIALTRIMIMTVPLFTISNVWTALLTAERRFWAVSWSPVFYNLGIIAGILGSVYMGPIALGWGVVIGAFLHAVVQYPELRRSGWHFRSEVKVGEKLVTMFRWGEAGKELVRLMVPRTLSLGMGQITKLLMTFLVTGYGTGRLAAFYFSTNVESVPLGLIGVSLSFVAFPLLAAAHTERRDDAFLANLEKNIAVLLFILAPIVALTIGLREEIVRLLLGTGAFDWEATQMTAMTLGILALAMIPDSLTPLLNKSLFARGDTRTTLVVNIVSFFVTGIVALVGGKVFGYVGVVFGFVLGSWVDAILLARAVSKSVSGFWNVVRPLFRNTAAAVCVVGALAFGSDVFGSFLFDRSTVVGLVAQSIAVISLGMTGFFAFQAWARPIGWTVLMGYAKRWRRLRFGGVFSRTAADTDLTS